MAARLKTTFKQGATSIYVVVISTLLFSVITFSFIRIIISEAAKTTSDELAQSAYDSALAGVEDAKTAIKRYYECVAITDAANKPEGCSVIEAAVKKGFEDQNYCDSVSEALGRLDTSASAERPDVKEVLIQEQSKTGGDSANVIQAYTCISMDNTLDDYRSTLSSGTPIRVIPLKTADANSITGIRILWYTENDGPFESLTYGSKEKYYPVDGNNPTPTPPTLSAEIIQTGDEFKLEDFNTSSGNTTNRGTVILTPAGKDSGTTHIDAGVVVNSNNHDYNRNNSQNDSYNKAQKIKCQTNLSEEFACVASIALPKPIGGTRRKSDDNEGTFYLILSLPYSDPTTTFSVQLCNDAETGHVAGDCLINENPNEPSIAQFKDVQISVDSTGRANDMYSRVEARVELNDVFFPFPEFAIHATGSGDDTLKKNFYITSNCLNSSDPDQINNPPCPNTDD